MCREGALWHSLLTCGSNSASMANSENTELAQHRTAHVKARPRAACSDYGAAPAAERGGRRGGSVGAPPPGRSGSSGAYSGTRPRLREALAWWLDMHKQLCDIFV